MLAGKQILKILLNNTFAYVTDLHYNVRAESAEVNPFRHTLCLAQSTRRVLQKGLTPAINQSRHNCLN